MTLFLFFSLKEILLINWIRLIPLACQNKRIRLYFVKLRARFLLLNVALRKFPFFPSRRPNESLWCAMIWGDASSIFQDISGVGLGPFSSLWRQTKASFRLLLSQAALTFTSFGISRPRMHQIAQIFTTFSKFFGGEGACPRTLLGWKSP